MKNQTYRFAQFELNLAESELRNGNSTVLIQEKPLLLLCALLDNPQRLVTREQLRDRMWDSRTVVNYEQGINVAIKKLRDALGDSAESPNSSRPSQKKGTASLFPSTLSRERSVHRRRTRPRSPLTRLRSPSPPRRKPCAAARFFWQLPVGSCAPSESGFIRHRSNRATPLRSVHWRCCRCETCPRIPDRNISLMELPRRSSPISRKRFRCA